MDKKEVIELIKEVGYEQKGSINSDGEYVEYCKGDEEYLFDNEEINELAEKLIRLLGIGDGSNCDAIFEKAPKFTDQDIECDATEADIY